MNVDPGTMNPYQHGEVFVTHDGAETDLDIGHYERFIDEEFPRFQACLPGRCTKKCLIKSAKGCIWARRSRSFRISPTPLKSTSVPAPKKSGADIFICEIGGTVGDIEAEPYLEAIRQLHHEEKHHNIMFVHLVLLPYLKSSGELKTKPAQASVRELRKIGINADVILCRFDDDHIDREHLEKIALFCDVPMEAVIPAPTVASIYEVPLEFRQSKYRQAYYRSFSY